MVDGYAAPKSKLDLTPGYHPYVSCLMVFTDVIFVAKLRRFPVAAGAHFSQFRGR